MRLEEFNERMVKKHNAKGLFREENKLAKEKAAMEDVAMSRRLPRAIREKAKRILDRGDLDRTQVVVDERKSKEYDRAVGQDIQMAIARGVLPKPRNDDQRRRFMQHARNAQ